MTVWRLHIRPSADTTADPVETCLDQEVIGIGWGVDEPPDSPDEYFVLGEKEYGYSSWRTAAKYLIHELEEDDLVWFRDFDGMYYLARVDGGWEYRDGSENQAADLFNIRSVEIHQVERTVPGKLKNSFIPARTLQRVRNQTVQRFTKLVYNSLTGSERYDLPDRQVNDVFDLLHDTELEDAVGIYLQHENGFMVVPSSRSRRNDTIAYEFELVHRDTGDRAYLQVKGGNTRLDPRDYEEKEGTWFLFSPAGYKASSSAESVLPLNRTEIRSFLEENRLLLPLSIRAWLEYAEDGDL